MKKILITGGAGFIGSHLARRLLKDGNEVFVLDNLFTGSKGNIIDLLDHPRFNFVLHDVTVEFRGQYDEIYNLACPASPVHYQRNPVETIRASVLGAANVLELALKTKAKVLHASTSEIYGDPEQHPQKESYWGNVNPIGPRSCYDEGKRAAETLCSDYHKEFGTDVRIVRIFNTYGPNMYIGDGRVVSNFIVQALKGEDITIYGSGEQTRSFQYVDDLVEAMIRFMEMDRVEMEKKFKSLDWEGVPVLNTGNPHEFTIKELAQKIISLCGSKNKIIFKELPRDDPKQRRPDISHAKEVLSWEPKIQLDVGLKKTMEYFRKELGKEL